MKYASVQPKKINAICVKLAMEYMKVEIMTMIANNVREQLIIRIYPVAIILTPILWLRLLHAEMVLKLMGNVSLVAIQDIMDMHYLISKQESSKLTASSVIVVAMNVQGNYQRNASLVLKDTT